MNKEEMLNRIIDNLMVGESPRTVIRYLLYLGFGEDDIVSLGFDRKDVREMDEEMSRDGYDGECVCPIFV